MPDRLREAEEESLFGAGLEGGGRVGSQSFRVNPGVEDYTVELYCDRLFISYREEISSYCQAFNIYMLFHSHLTNESRITFSFYYVS